MRASAASPFRRNIADCVFTAADLVGVKPIRAVSGLPGFKVSEQPVLATGKVRQVGELVAMCVAPTRAEAEDIAAAVDAGPRGTAGGARHAGRRASPARRWCTSIGATTSSSKPSSMSTIDKAFDAPIKVTREIAHRAPMHGADGGPRRGRRLGTRRLEQLDRLHRRPDAAHQPHRARPNASALDQAAVRVDRRRMSAAASATRASCCRRKSACRGWRCSCGHPVRWIEDRREHLTASANCREHHYRITGYADRDGRLRGIDCEATVDSGAYSSYPFSACLEAAQVASILPGPYDFEAYRCRTWSVATNKCPILPYRGVARTGVCFAMELVLDAVAREAGIEPLRGAAEESRAARADAVRQHHQEAFRQRRLSRGAAPRAGGDRPRRRPRAAEARRARRPAASASASAIYCEQGAHGTSVYAGWGIPMVPGHEQATARMTPDGGLELRVGVHSHGQGLETTLAQVAHEILGIDVAKIKRGASATRR